MTQMHQRKKGWIKRTLRIRKYLSGSSERPRLAVYKSNQHLYAQVIDDVKRITLVSCSTQDKEFKGKATKNLKGAVQVGKILAKRAKAKGIQKVVFDRHGFKYHGRLKALADSAREGGLEF